eukprot:9725275-Karenia_brevis.AAC.1
MSNLSTPADALAALADATDRIIALEGRVMEQQAVMNNQAAEMLRQSAIMERLVATEGGRAQQSMVDTKTMTPELFGENKNQPTWRSWSKRTKSYANQFYHGAVKNAMDMAEMDPHPITRDRMDEYGVQ